MGLTDRRRRVRLPVLASRACAVLYARVLKRPKTSGWSDAATKVVPSPEHSALPNAALGHAAYRSGGARL